MGETYIDLKTAAKKLGLNPATLQTAAKSKELTVIKGVWRTHRTTEKWIQEWLDRKTLKANQSRGRSSNAD